MIETVKVTPIELVPAVSRNASLTGQYFDTKDLIGDLVLVLSSSAASGGTATLDVKLQSADTGTGTYGDVTGGAFTQVTTSASFQTIIIPRASVKRYVKVIGTAGAGSTTAYAVIALARKADTLNSTPSGT